MFPYLSRTCTAMFPPFEVKPTQQCCLTWMEPKELFDSLYRCSLITCCLCWSSMHLCTPFFWYFLNFIMVGRYPYTVKDWKNKEQNLVIGTLFQFLLNEVHLGIVVRLEHCTPLKWNYCLIWLYTRPIIPSKGEFSWISRIYFYEDSLKTTCAWNHLDSHRIWPQKLRKMKL